MSAAVDPAGRSWPLPALLLGVFLMVLTLTTSTAPCATPIHPEGEDDGLDLLRRAARAERGMAYEGVRWVASGAGGRSGRRLVEVVHRPGEGTGFAAARPATSGGPDTSGQAEVVVGRPRGEPGVSERMLRELARNYHVTRAGSSEVCGRRTTVVEARRANGAIAGRYWIDDRTALPLRQEARDERGRVVRSTAFTSIEVGQRTEPLPTAAQETRPWGDTLSEDEKGRLRADGWHLPTRLTPAFALIEARSTAESGQRVVHLTYSDGLSVVSVFVQRGRLDTESGGTTEGLTPVEVDGGTVYVDDSEQQRRMWESGGFVYTVLADAPPGAVDTAVAALPAPEGGAFWPRVSRGFGRLGSWIGA